MNAEHQVAVNALTSNHQTQLDGTVAQMRVEHQAAIDDLASKHAAAMEEQRLQHALQVQKLQEAKYQRILANGCKQSIDHRDGSMRSG